MGQIIKPSSAQLSTPAPYRKIFPTDEIQAKTCFNILQKAHSTSLIKELDLGLPALTYKQLVEDPNIQKQVLEALESSRLNELGMKLKKLIAGKVFVDLGCGNPASSFMPRVIAQIFGARSYVGVDFQLGKNIRLKNEFKEFGEFGSYFRKNDIVPFLEEARATGNKGRVVFYLCGIESPFRNNRETRPEIENICGSIMGNIEAVTLSGDGVILGPKTNGFEPEGYGFACTHGIRKNPTGYIDLDKTDKLPKHPSPIGEMIMMEDYKAAGIDPFYSDYFHSIFVRN
jgi:hypothetical protein